MNEMLKAIQSRLSARGPFDLHRPLTQEDLQQILEAGRWAPTAHNMQNFEIIVVDDKSVLKKLADLKSPISQAFIWENYQQLSFSVEELKRKKVGILGIWFPAFMRDLSIKPKPEEKISSSQGYLVKKNPVLLVIVYDPSKRAPASKGDTLGFMSLGCVMENMWLMAHSLGINFHIVSSFNDGAVEGKAKKILGIPKNLKIAFTCRLGYTSTPERYLRVRRDVKDFTSYNQYGNKHDS
jgi:nitroreductase